MFESVISALSYVSAHWRALVAFYVYRFTLTAIYSEGTLDFVLALADMHSAAASMWAETK